MQILWITKHASFMGGCENYIFHTAGKLKEMGVSSTLLYDPAYPCEVKFFEPFTQAFPLVDLARQLVKIPHDLVYIHQLDDPCALDILSAACAPTVRFLHDHQLFCLYGSKLPYFSNTPCQKVPGCRCYPLGCALKRSCHFPYLRMVTLAQLKKLQALNQNLDHIVVASHYMAKEAQANGFEAAKISTIYPYALPPATTESRFKRDSRHLLFVGQLLRTKGLDVLLQACAQLPQGFLLTVAGDGPQKARCQQLAEILGVKGRITFRGRVSQEQLDQLYQQASCLVCPSRWPEPFGLVGPEAMSYGIPVVGSAVGAIPEWLQDGKTGLLVAPNDVNGLVSAIQAIDSDALLAKAMGHAAMQAWREKFQPQQHLAALLELFQRLIKQKMQAQQQRWQGFTRKGSPAAERRMDAIVADVATVVKSDLPGSDYHALLLIGSYGKGEGGIEKITGQEFPHNNLDLMLVAHTRQKSVLAALKHKLDLALLPVSAKYQIGFDTSALSRHKLQCSSVRLLWHEASHGHKLVLGSRAMPFSPQAQDIANVPSSEFAALLANRCTLLAINDWVLAKAKGQELSLSLRKVVIRHIMKAIIGCGDAFLYFAGHYHWSYSERLKTMQQQFDVPVSLRSLYCQAAAFRFETDYGPYLDKDLTLWMAEVRSQLMDVWLKVQREYLAAPDLAWHEYVETVLLALWRQGIMWRQWRYLVRKPACFIGQTWRAKSAFACLAPQQRLTLLLPLIAFAQGSAGERSQAAKFLGVTEVSSEMLREGYLKMWSRYGDINFPRSLGL